MVGPAEVFAGAGDGGGEEGAEQGDGEEAEETFEAGSLAEGVAGVEDEGGYGGDDEGDAVGNRRAGLFGFYQAGGDDDMQQSDGDADYAETGGAAGKQRGEKTAKLFFQN